MARRQADPDVLAAISELVLAGWRPPAIERQLAPRFGDRLPSRRTLYSIVAELHPPTGPGWSIATADPEDAVLILPVLAAVTRNSEGRMGHFTEATAGWIARIRRVAPSLEPIAAYRWAVRYQTTTAAGKDTRELDRELALDMEKPPRQE